MIPPQHASDEQFKEISEDFLKFFRSIWTGNGRRQTLVLSAKVLLIASLVTTAFGVLFATGQSYAIGIYPAWRTYHLWWVLSPLAGPATIVAFFIIGFIFYVGGYKSMTLFEGLLSERGKKIFDKVFFRFMIVVGLGLLISMPVFIGYDVTQKSNKLLSDTNSEDVIAITQSVAEQNKTLDDLSASATHLLSQLDTTERLLQGARTQLAETLSTLTTQINAADVASRNAEVLLDRQRQIELRITELERILDGQAPITKKDLEDSGRTGLLIGALLGFLGSIAASFVVNMVSKMRRKKS